MNCPLCHATVLPSSFLGLACLNEPNGQAHVCPSVVLENERKNLAQVEAFHLLKGSFKISDTTGNRVPRWSFKDGCVEPY